MHRQLLAFVLVLFAAPLAAQQRADTTGWKNDLPPAVARDIADFFNDPRTIHFSGRTRIPAERVVEGDVAVLGGPFTIAGRIQGRVAVINGDVELLPGALISGNLTVVGGTVSGLDGARVGGEILAFSEPLRYRRGDDERIVLAEAQGGDPRSRDDTWGRSDFVVTSGQSYNRVEGLPIIFGPRIETASANPLRVRAFAIYRTESGWTLDTDRLGYELAAEQFLGGHRAFRIGATLHSIVAPIEDWHLSDLENALSTFLFHEDFRDHYERDGWSVFGTWEPRRGPASLTAEFRSERHRSLPAGSPFSLFDNADTWRPQPLVGEGRLQSVLLRGRYDTRSDKEDPASGWLVRGQVERGLTGELERPAAVTPLDGAFVALPERSYGTFTYGLADVRWYNRVSPDSRLNFRVIGGGALGGGVLPPQRQHALGGEGSLPGYSLFSRDCGARSGIVYRAHQASTPQQVAEQGTPAYVPSYGCDRFALFQAEYRGKFDFRLDWPGSRGEDDDEYDDDWVPHWDSSLDWVAFVDAGRGWGAGDRPDDSLALDLGLGLLFDRIGVYAAVPLSGGKGVNLFVRLGPRF